MPRHTNTSRRGFILVMTLMLLAIAAVALASAGRSSMGLAVDAVQARQGLQRRWGNISSRHAVLELASNILDSTGADSNQPRRSIRTQIQLNTYTYTLTLCDEQAKANINTMLHDRGREATRTYIRKQCGSHPWADEITLPTTHTQPTPQETSGTDVAHREIISINHFLPAFDPGSIDSEGEHPLGALTCWGDGRINLTRAPDGLVQAVLKPLMSTAEITRLRKSLTASESKSLIDALKNTSVSEDNTPKILKRLTLDSSCYSVWINVDNGKRSWHELAVVELQPEGSAEPSRTEEAAEATEAPSTITADNSQPTVLPSIPDETNQNESGEEMADLQDNTDLYPRLYLYQW